MVDVASFAAVSLQGGMFCLVVVAIRREDTAAAINALVALVLAVLPFLLEILIRTTLARSVFFGPILPVWLAFAGFIHSLGMLGVYESTWWWDHLTHTVSAALLAALIYAGLVVTFPDIAGSSRSAGAITAVLGSTLGVGIFWELVELVARDVGERYGIEPVLVHYGWGDTAADLVFDLLGALIVLGLDLRVFVPAVEQFPDTARSVLIGGGWVVFVGSITMALFVGVERYVRS